MSVGTIPWVCHVTGLNRTGLVAGWQSPCSDSWFDLSWSAADVHDSKKKKVMPLLESVRGVKRT